MTWCFHDRVVQLTRKYVFGAGDDAWYCDGWSEKQFDIDQAASKCVHWIGQNPLDSAGNDQGDAITGEPAPSQAPWRRRVCSAS